MTDGKVLGMTPSQVEPVRIECLTDPNWVPPSLREYQPTTVTSLVPDVYPRPPRQSTLLSTEPEQRNGRRDHVLVDVAHGDVLQMRGRHVDGHRSIAAVECERCTAVVSDMARYLLGQVSTMQMKVAQWTYPVTHSSAVRWLSRQRKSRLCVRRGEGALVSSRGGRRDASVLPSRSRRTRGVSSLSGRPRARCGGARRLPARPPMAARLPALGPSIARNGARARSRACSRAAHTGLGFCGAIEARATRLAHGARGSGGTLAPPRSMGPKPAVEQ